MQNQAWNKLKENKPAIFDWLVFIFSFSLGFIFPSLAQFVASRSFSNWMLAALVLYVVGVLLKHRPLYYRLAISGNKQEAIPYLLFLIIGHWVIMVAVIIFAEEAFRRITGLPQIGAGGASGYSTFLGIFIAAFITWLVFRPAGKNIKPLSKSNLFYRELIADTILITGVAMLSFVFWEKSILAVMTQMPMGSIGDVCMRFILLSLAYIMFYLPLRYLYLVEDHFSKGAWRRLMLIFGFIVLRGLLAALHF